MTSSKKHPVGSFQEPTTYRYDFHWHDPIQRTPSGRCLKKNLPVVRNRNCSCALPETMTSYDTLQQLDYKTRLPFDAMLRPKEIIGTHPQKPFSKRMISSDKGLLEAIKTRPRLYVSPGISLDNVENPNTRKLMVDFTYTTTSRRAEKEACAGFEPKVLSLPDTVFEKKVDPLALRIQLIPDIPAGFQAAARKWDSCQERWCIDETPKCCKSEQEHTDDLEEKDSMSTEEKEKLRSLLRANKLRLPYLQMPTGYGGFRPCLATGVKLASQEVSPYDPNLSVAKAVAARYTAAGSKL